MIRIPPKSGSWGYSGLRITCGKASVNACELFVTHFIDNHGHRLTTPLNHLLFTGCPCEALCSLHPKTLSYFKENAARPPRIAEPHNKLPQACQTAPPTRRESAASRNSARWQTRRTLRVTLGPWRTSHFTARHSQQSASSRMELWGCCMRLAAVRV